VKNGHWVKEFKALGIEIIEGVNADDKNALIRQSTVFQYFNHLTTDAWGSQIAYKLYYGMKVSICGPSPRLKNNSCFIEIYMAEKPGYFKTCNERCGTKSEAFVFKEVFSNT
jgi:hypothetical protein